MSGEASAIYDVDEVVESVLGSERLGLGSSHLQKHAPGRDGAGSCGSVTSHKTGGLGLSEGIWHLGELCKAGGELSIALKAFVSNEMFSAMWVFPPATSLGQQLGVGWVVKTISSRLKINCSILPLRWGPPFSSTCACSHFPAEAAILQSLPSRRVLGGYFWRIQRRKGISASTPPFSTSSAASLKLGHAVAPSPPAGRLPSRTRGRLAAPLGSSPSELQVALLGSPSCSGAGQA